LQLGVSILSVFSRLVLDIGALDSDRFLESCHIHTHILQETVLLLNVQGYLVLGRSKAPVRVINVAFESVTAFFVTLNFDSEDLVLLFDIASVGCVLIVEILHALLQI